MKIETKNGKISIGENMKNRHFKLFGILIFSMLLVFTTSCKKNNPEDEITQDIVLSILSVNDFHGQLEEVDGASGAARIAGFVKEVRGENPDSTILLSAGDMFQGTGLSNVGFGKDVVNFMNMLDFDAMAIGNHEFDWTLDKVLSYRDGNDQNGEAEFPFLSTNIYQKSTNGLPEHIDEYTIIERKGLKIAIIGFIGETQENDIAPSMIADYSLDAPLEEVRENIKDARTNHGADLVIVLGHEDNSKLNNSLASGTGEYEVNAIINGHSHDLENSRIYRKEDQQYVPVVQSKSSGEYVGQTTLIIDPITKDVKNSAVRNVRMTANRTKDSEVETFVTNVRSSYSHIFDRELCVAGDSISRAQGTSWAVNALFAYANREFGHIDLAFINPGGIRSNAFPINKNEVVTVNHVYRIMPFDNTVKITELTGKQLIHAMKITDTVLGGYYQISGNNYYINGELIDESAIYRVIAVDYLFDNANYPFLNGQNSVYTNVLFRDVLIKELELLGQNNNTWLC